MPRTKRGTYPKEWIDAPPIKFKDYPTPPTPEVEKEYQEWLSQRTIRINDPTTSQFKINPARYQYHYKNGTLRRCDFFISQTAYTNLRTMSRKHFYSHDKGEHQRGLSQFIRALANPDIHWIDTRPQDIQDIDYVRLTHNPPLLPLWTTPDDRDDDGRKHRGIYINDNSLTTLYRLALSRAIIKPTTINPKKTEPLRKVPVVGYLLEVIGLGYLTPNNIPINPNPTYNHYRKPSYKVWNERRFIVIEKQPKADMIRDAARKEGLLPYEIKEADYYITD